MRYFCVTDAGGVQTFRKVPAGRTPEEMGVPAGAEEVGRLPKDFECRRDGAWALDEAAAGEARENARLRVMSPRQRQEEAIEKALQRLRHEAAARGAGG